MSYNAEILSSNLSDPALKSIANDLILCLEKLQFPLEDLGPDYALPGIPEKQAVHKKNSACMLVGSWHAPPTLLDHEENVACSDQQSRVANLQTKSSTMPAIVGNGSPDAITRTFVVNWAPLAATGWRTARKLTAFLAKAADLLTCCRLVM